VSRICQCCGRGLGQDDVCQCERNQQTYTQTDRLVLSALAGLKTIEQTMARHEKRIDFHQERLDKLDESNRHHFQRLDAHSNQLQNLAPVVDAEFDTTVPKAEYDRVLAELHALGRRFNELHKLADMAHDALRRGLEK
jgi:hypothetical protein